MTQTTNTEDSPAGRNGTKAPRLASGTTPNGEVGQQVPPAAVSTPRDLGTLIRDFQAGHPARRQLYRTAIQAGGAAAQQERAQAQVDTDCKQAEVAYETAQQSADPSRTGSLRLHYGLAAGTIAVDGLSCHLAAQVFGGDQLSAVFVALLFLSGLAGGVLALDVAGRRKARTAWRWIAGLLAGFIVVLGVLRFAFLLTVNGSLLTALLGAGLFTVTTAGLVALGYWALREAEPVEMYRQRRRLRKAQRNAAKAGKIALRTAKARDERVQAYTDEMQPWLVETQSHLTADEVKETVRAVTQHLRAPAVSAPHGLA